MYQYLFFGLHEFRLGCLQLELEFGALAEILLFGGLEFLREQGELALLLFEGLEGGGSLGFQFVDFVEASGFIGLDFLC